MDEFNISSHRSKFRGWVLKDHKPAIVAALDKFSMYFVIAASSQHIYGIMASEKANTAEVFMYFLDNLLIHSERLFNKCSEKTLFIIDNASIHKTKSVDEYAKRKEIPLLTIPPYSPALNGTETIIQSIKSKVNLQRSDRRYCNIELYIFVLINLYWLEVVYSLKLVARCFWEHRHITSKHPFMSKWNRDFWYFFTTCAWKILSLSHILFCFILYYNFCILKFWF